MLNMGSIYNAWGVIYNDIQNHTHRQWYELGVIFVIYYMFIFLLLFVHLLILVQHFNSCNYYHLIF
jgi:hypothetical protein